VYENPLLTTCDAPALTSISDRLYVDLNTALTSLGIPLLTHIGGGSTITRNTSLADCFEALLAQLVGYTGTVTIGSNGMSCP